MKKSIYQKNYQELVKIMGEKFWEIDHAIVSVEGMMDLIYETLDKLDATEGEEYRIALAYYYEQNGDLMADPCFDILLRVFEDTEKNTIESLSWRLDGLGMYREVYTDENRTEFYPREKKGQNEALSEMINAAIQSGYKYNPELVEQSQD